MDAKSHADWLSWQVVDSAFPTGAFVHSWGLEASWQQGEVPNAAAVAQFLIDAIVQVGHGTLPLLNAAYRDPRRLPEFDERADAFLLNAVANRASRQQGRTLLATAIRVWPSPRLAAIEIASRDACAHVAPLSGAVFHAIGLPLATAQHVVLYSAARGVLTAAVRLGIAGSYEAQRLQSDCASTLDVVSHACAALDIDDLAHTAPLVDILQGGHDRLYSRLFQS